MGIESIWFRWRLLPGGRGHPREIEFREAINAVRYLVILASGAKHSQRAPDPTLIKMAHRTGA